MHFCNFLIQAFIPNLQNQTFSTPQTGYIDPLQNIFYLLFYRHLLPSVSTLLFQRMVYMDIIPRPLRHIRSVSPSSSYIYTVLPLASDSTNILSYRAYPPLQNISQRPATFTVASSISFTLYPAITFTKFSAIITTVFVP